MECKFLSDYPRLESWYNDELFRFSANHERPSIADKFKLDVCHSLTLDSFRRFKLWSKNFKSFLEATVNPLDDFSDCSAFFLSHEIDLQILASDMGTVAFEIDEGINYFHLMQNAAESTGLVSMHFLAAWLALNLDEPELCVRECDKVDTPFAPIYTIQGQALLEQGKAIEAIESLNVAVNIDKKEILAWFQLAKAHLILGQEDYAWEAANTCVDLSPNNPEVGLLLTMIALRGSNHTRLREAWDILSANLVDECDNTTLVVNLLDLAFRAENRAWGELVTERAHWEKLFSRQDFIKNLGPMLRAFGELGWMDLASQVLGQFNEQHQVLPLPKIS